MIRVSDLNENYIVVHMGPRLQVCTMLSKTHFKNVKTSLQTGFIHGLFADILCKSHVNVAMTTILLK